MEFSPVPRSSCISLVSPGWITVPRMLMAYSASLLTVIFAVCIPWAREPSFRLNWPVRMTARGVLSLVLSALTTPSVFSFGFAPIFPDTCYHLTHYWPAAADIPVASDNPAHYADAIRYNARTPLQGSLLPLTRLVWA